MIEKLIYGGYGLARTKHKVVFVKDGVSGDEVEVEISEHKKSYDIAEIIKFIKPSNYRTVSECEYFGKCGGCQWQHIDYQYQLKAKEQVLRESLERISGIKNFNINPIIYSKYQYNYRNRLILHLDSNKGKNIIGFKEAKSNKLVPIHNCSISSNKISNIIHKISNLLKDYQPKVFPFEKIYITDIGTIPALSIALKRNVPESDSNKLFYKLKEHLFGVDISYVNKKEKSFEFDVLGLKFISSPSVFAQANPDVNEKLIESLLKWAGLGKDQNVLDLYCGYGNFSLHIARKVRNLIGIDNNSKAIQFAKENAELNSIRNCSFKSVDVKIYLEKHNSKERFDLIVLDPPRNGAKEIIKSILNLQPSKILYVSCNPATLARDLKLSINSGYKLINVQPFDMFPQTFHVESLALLEYRTDNLY